MTDDNNNIGLSRRRVLGGLGAVGIASAGAGLGTTAYFSDQESFVGNTLTAGELTLYVNYHAYADQGEYLGEYLMEGVTGNGDSEVDHSFELDDVKPGDSGRKKFCFSIVDNPSYMWACGMLTEEIAGTGGGQLADHLTATLRYCESHDERPADGDIGAHVAESDGDVIAEGSFRDVLGALTNGVPLDADGDGGVDAGDRACFDGSDSQEEFQDTCLCLDWEFPIRSVDPDAELDNNDAQAASMEFDLSFHAEQCRHNDGLTNPCITTTEVEGFGKGEDAEKLWFSKVRNGGTGFNLQVGDTLTDQSNANYDFGGSSFAGTVSLAYDAPSGMAELTVDNSSTGTVSYDVDDTPGNVLSIVARGNDSGHRTSVSNVQVNGTTPTGSDAVESDGDEIVSLNVEGLNTGSSWELTADLEFDGLDSSGSASDENPAMYVDVLSV